MAINAADLEKLTLKQIEGLLKACQYFYPLISSGKAFARTEPGGVGVPGVGKWESAEEFREEVAALGGVLKAYDTLLAKKADLSSLEEAPAPEAPAATTPDKIQLDKLVEDYEKAKTEAEREKVLVANKNIKFVREFTKIDKIKPEDFKKQILYAEPVEGTKEVSLSGTEATAFEKLRDSALKDPKNFVENTAKEIQKNIPAEVAADLTKEELGLSAKLVASDLATRLTTNTQALPPEVFTSLASSEELLRQAALSPELASFLKEGSVVFGAVGRANDINVRAFLYPSFGSNFVNFLYGPEGGAFRFTDSPGDKTAFAIDLQKLGASFKDLQGSNVFKLITSPISDSIKPQLLSEGQKALNSFLSRFPKDSFLSRAISSSLGKQGFQLLSSFGTEYSASGAFGSFLKIAFPEYLPIIHPLTSWLGIDVGITATGIVSAPVAGAAVEKSVASAGFAKAVGVAAGKLVEKGVAKVAGAFVGETAGAALGAQVGTAVAPIIGTAVGAIVGFLGGKVFGKLFSWLKEKIAGNKGLFVGLFSLGVFGLGIATGIVPLAVAGVLGMGLGIGLAFSLPAAAVISQGAGMISGVFFGITSIAIASISSVAIISLIAFPVIVAIILFIINSGAYIVPPSPSFVAGVIESPYVGITKTVVGKDTFENNAIPESVTYQINVRAKKGTLVNVHLDDTCEVTRSGEGPGCPETELPTYPNFVSPTKAISFTYSQALGENFKDSSIINTITVTADTPDGGATEALTSASVKIGNPPEECPSGWPGHGDLTQGANGPYSHRGAEAIDISMVTGNRVVATHTGIVVAYGQDSGAYGRHVEIKSTCGGKEYFSRYAHLSVISVRTGQKVSAGSEIGLSGNSGASMGAHLHYEFRYPSGPTSYPKNPPYMMRPYTPKDLPRNCTERAGCNNVKIP